MRSTHSDYGKDVSVAKNHIPLYHVGKGRKIYLFSIRNARRVKRTGSLEFCYVFKPSLRQLRQLLIRRKYFDLKMLVLCASVDT